MLKQRTLYDWHIHYGVISYDTGEMWTCTSKRYAVSIYNELINDFGYDPKTTHLCYECKDKHVLFN